MFFQISNPLERNLYLYPFPSKIYFFQTLPPPPQNFCDSLCGGGGEVVDLIWNHIRLFTTLLKSQKCPLHVQCQEGSLQFMCEKHSSQCKKRGENKQQKYTKIVHLHWRTYPKIQALSMLLHSPLHYCISDIWVHTDVTSKQTPYLPSISLVAHDHCLKPDMLHWLPQPTCIVPDCAIFIELVLELMLNCFKEHSDWLQPACRASPTLPTAEKEKKTQVG